MKDLTFKTRLSFLIALVLLLIAATGLLSLSKLHGVAQSVDSVYKERLLPMQQLRLVSQGFTVGLRSSAQRLADGQLAALLAQQELDDIERNIRDNWARYLDTRLLPQEQRLIDALRPLLDGGLRELDQLRQLARSGDEEALHRIPLRSLQ